MKKLFNRRAVVTTSKGRCTATHEIPVLHDLSNGKFGGPVEMDFSYRLRAKSRTRGGNPQENRWDITEYVDIYQAPVATNISFDYMARIMKVEELKIARQAGCTGTDEQIAEQRRKSVRKSNILNLKVT